jgi:hypothetical protein
MQLIGQVLVRLLVAHRSSVVDNLVHILMAVYSRGVWCGELSGSAVPVNAELAARLGAQRLWNVMLCVVQTCYASDIDEAAEAFRNDLDDVRVVVCLMCSLLSGARGVVALCCGASM